MKKKIGLTSLGLVALLLLGSGTTFAQKRSQQNRQGMANALDLTEDQQKQFQEIRISHQKGLVYDNNLIREKPPFLCKFFVNNVFFFYMLYFKIMVSRTKCADLVMASFH